MGDKRTQLPLGSHMCWAVSLGIGKALSLSSIKSSSDEDELTVVGEEGMEEERIT